jgi:hypothetical protein
MYYNYRYVDIEIHNLCANQIFYNHKSELCILQKTISKFPSYRTYEGQAFELSGYGGTHKDPVTD